MSKSINKKQSEVKRERIALIEELIITGLTTTRQVHGFIKDKIEEDENSKYNFRCHIDTLMNYIKIAKNNVISSSKPNYLLLSSFLNEEFLSIVIMEKGVDNETRIKALDKIAKLNGLYDMELMKRLKYDDILKEDVDQDKILNSLSEKEIKERRMSRKSKGERVI